MGDRKPTEDYVKQRKKNEKVRVPRGIRYVFSVCVLNEDAREKERQKSHPISFVHYYIDHSSHCLPHQMHQKHKVIADSESYKGVE